MKILCLGNNTELTDKQTSLLASDNDSKNNGLLSDLEGEIDLDMALQDGYYHTSVLDISLGRIQQLATKFDKVIVLDQPLNLWNHAEEFYATQNLALKLSVPVQWNNSKGQQQIQYWKNLVDSNPSFCIFPFIELLVNNGHTTVCCRSSNPVTNLNNLEDFSCDSNYKQIRSSMIAGKTLPDHCSACYKLESQGIRSARQQETEEWAIRLDLQNINDLQKIKKPVYYEVRPNNVCNLMCRICYPQCSSKIEKEWKNLGWIDKNETYKYSGFEIVDTQDIKKLYVAGGEPTAMPEFYDFLQHCVDKDDTNFEFMINTNAVKVSDKLLKLCKNFTNIHFIVSVDGYKKANDYSRWGSNWDTVIQNVRRLQSNGHKVTFNITLSLYTIFDFDKLVYFLENRFPGCLIHGAFADNVYPFVFEFSQEQIARLEAIKSTNTYLNDDLFASFVNGVVDLATKSTLNKQKLKHFFNFNDTLDISRNSCLNDSIPELEQLRKFL